MVGVAEQIIVFYVLGLIMFVFGIETKKIPHTFIYLGLSFFINLMGYFISYNNDDFVQTAYLPIVLAIISIVFLLYYGFDALKVATNDKYKDDIGGL